jgi:flagellar biosynthetic protein FliR
MQSLLDQLGPFLLALLRMSGIFVFAPLLSSVAIPDKVKVLLVFLITVAVFPVLPASARPPMEMDVLSLAMAGVFEVLLGVVIGLIALLPVLAVQLGSSLIGQQMGFGIAQVYNPTLETESDPIGELLLHMSLVAFIALGGLEALFLCVANTFEKVPLGTVTSTSIPADMVLGAISGGLELALRISSPVLGIILIETIATAFLMKTMPTLNILSIGFAVKIVLGFAVLFASLGAIDAVISGHVEEVLRAMMRWSVGELRGG